MRILLFPILSLFYLVFATTLAAQEEVNTSNIRDKTIAAIQNVSAISATLENDLTALIPTVTGWTCRQTEMFEDVRSRTYNAIPTVNITCENADQLLRLTMLLDPSSAALFCKVIDLKQEGIATGRVQPVAFRFFENETWRIQRAFQSISGCAGAITILSNKLTTQAALDAGPASIDAFAEALLKSDTSTLLNSTKYADQQAALNDLVEILNVQSQLLADIIPSLPGVIKEIIVPLQIELPEDRRPVLPMMLAGSPSAAANLTVEGCRVLVELSASPLVLHEARNTGREWGRKGGTDGAVTNAYIRRNTERLVGQERVNGMGIELIVDDRVVVRVMIPTARLCENNPTIVRRVVDEILTHDLSVFGTD